MDFIFKNEQSVAGSQFDTTNIPRYLPTQPPGSDFSKSVPFDHRTCGDANERTHGGRTHGPLRNGISLVFKGE